MFPQKKAEDNRSGDRQTAEQPRSKVASRGECLWRPSKAKRSSHSASQFVRRGKVSCTCRSFQRQQIFVSRRTRAASLQMLFGLRAAQRVELIVRIRIHEAMKFLTIHEVRPPEISGF